MDLHEVAIEVAQEKLAKVNRLEVIDEDGRSYTRYFKTGERLQYQFQDDDQTLKIFVSEHDWGFNKSTEEPVQDSREEIEVDFTDEELLEYMKQAHEMDITFNQFVEQVLRKYIEKQTSVESEVSCKTHPDAPHGFNRNASHSLGRYVCDCEYWEEDDESDW